MNEERLQELLVEATIDCYGEDEQFSCILAALEDELNFPLAATLIGETVELIGLDGPASSSQRGIVAQVRRKGQTYRSAWPIYKSPILIPLAPNGWRPITIGCDKETIYETY